MSKAIRDIYGEQLATLAETNKDIVVLDADVSSSTKSGIFASKYPERFLIWVLQSPTWLQLPPDLLPLAKYLL